MPPSLLDPPQLHTTSSQLAQQLNPASQPNPTHTPLSLLLTAPPLTHACAALTGVYAGLRASGRKGDLALVVADAPATVAGTFTQNVMCAAPVLYCKDVLSRRKTVRAVGRGGGAETGGEGEVGPGRRRVQGAGRTALGVPGRPSLTAACLPSPVTLPPSPVTAPPCNPPPVTAQVMTNAGQANAATGTQVCAVRGTGLEHGWAAGLGRGGEGQGDQDCGQDCGKDCGQDWFGDWVTGSPEPGAWGHLGGPAHHTAGSWP